MAVELRPVAVDEVVARVLDDVGTARRAGSGSRCRATYPRCSRTPACSSACWSTSCRTRSGSRLPASRRASRPPASGSTSSSGSSTRDPGITPEQRDEVFLPFQRLGDTDNTTGVGLGPRPVARTDRGDGRHPRAGGHPRRRTHDGGATPGRRRRRPGPGARAARTRSGGGLVTRVLVVDDEPQILRALAINLRARGYDVRTAGSGTEALATAAAHPPELVVLDLGLPDMDGTEVIAGLRGWTAVPGPRPLRPLGQQRQGGRPRRRRRRLRHQAVRHGRAARPAARDGAPGDARRGRPSRRTVRRHRGRPRLPQGRARR